MYYWAIIFARRREMTLFPIGRCALALVVLALVAGCATQNGHKALAQGRLDLAQRQATNAAQKGDPTGYNNLGVIAQQRGNNELAIRMFTIAARMGEPTAIMNLSQLGQSIPAADLVARQTEDAEDSGWDMVAAGVSGYAAGRYAAPQAPAYTPPARAPAITPYRAPPPAPMIQPPAPIPIPVARCQTKTVTENGKTRYVRVCT